MNRKIAEQKNQQFPNNSIAKDGISVDLESDPKTSSCHTTSKRAVFCRFEKNVNVTPCV